jgi:hypothetical protein
LGAVAATASLVAAMAEVTWPAINRAPAAAAINFFITVSSGLDAIAKWS